VSDAAPAASSGLSPLTLSVIRGALRSIAVEIGTTVHRTAYSEQAREGTCPGSQGVAGIFDYFQEGLRR